MFFIARWKKPKDKLPAEKYMVDSFYKVLKDVSEGNVTDFAVSLRKFLKGEKKTKVN